MKKIGSLKFHTAEEIFGKWAHSKSFQKAYEKECARLKLVRQERNSKTKKT